MSTEHLRRRQVQRVTFRCWRFSAGFEIPRGRLRCAGNRTSRSTEPTGTFDPLRTLDRGLIFVSPAPSTVGSRWASETCQIAIRPTPVRSLVRKLYPDLPSIIEMSRTAPRGRGRHALLRVQLPIANAFRAIILGCLTYLAAKAVILPSISAITCRTGAWAQPTASQLLAVAAIQPTTRRASRPAPATIVEDTAYWK